MKRPPGLYMTQAGGHSTRIAGNGAALVMAALATPAAAACAVGLLFVPPLLALGVGWRAVQWARGRR